jgi:hypothetical protein
MPNGPIDSLEFIIRRAISGSYNGNIHLDLSDGDPRKRLNRDENDRRHAGGSFLSASESTSLTVN